MEELTKADIVQIQRRNAVFELVTAEFPHSLCQKECRLGADQRGSWSMSLTYGEIEFKSLFQVFKWIQSNWKDCDNSEYNAFNMPGGTFVDLGHGTGKGILSGAFMHQFERCWGIEILESLVDVSINMKAAYDRYIAEVDSDEYLELFGWPKEHAASFEVVNGDMFQIDWSGADFVFANSTCFPQEMMEQIYQSSLKCKKGTWFVTMSRILPHAKMSFEQP